MTEVPAPSTAGFGRRLGALFYDVVLVIALCMVTSAAFLLLTGGEAVEFRAFPVLYFIHQAVLLGLITGFFIFFWARSGQTLGMSSWRIKLQGEDGGAISWVLASRRLVLAWLTLGLGLLWVLIDRQHLALYDRWTKTRVVVTPRIG